MASTRSKLLHIRIRSREWIEWKAAAKRADKTLSEWLREAAATKARAEISPRLVNE
jgi:hypothetical protein